jgi:hypothetical protein
MKNKEYFCPHCDEKFTGGESRGFCPICGVVISASKDGDKVISIQGENADDVKKVADSALQNSDVRNEIKISAPWGGMQRQWMYNVDRSSNPRIQEKFIKERSKVHLEYIKENEKTKRISLIASAILLALGLIIIVFSPSEKQFLSYWIGASLLLLAAGTAGYKRIWAKSKVLDIKADQDKD